MIARILYRKNVQGVLKYVLDKPHASVLGMCNIPKQILQYPKLLKHHFHFLGSRHESNKRFVHITLNLPHGEFLDDSKFCKLAEVYMEEMGYGEQPFVIVRHDDTKHEHVHIVSTRVKESGKLIDNSHDFSRNLAVQKYVEQMFGLSPSPESKCSQNLPVIRVPEERSLPDDSLGVRFYMQEILNTLCQQYKPRSFKELKHLIQPYHLVVSTTQNKSGRVGVSYGIAKALGYKSRFIQGYKVHPNLSGPKMERLFQKNARSKLLPTHRQRLKKQLDIVFKLFKTIDLKDLETILMEFQKLDTNLEFDKMGQPKSFTIYDKSGYVFKYDEIDRKLWSRIVSFQSDSDSVLDVNRSQFQLELIKCVEEILLNRHARSHTGFVVSEFMARQTFSAIQNDFWEHPKFALLSKYCPKEGLDLHKQLNDQYAGIQNKLVQKHHKRETQLLESQSQLISKVIEQCVFGLNLTTDTRGELFQSLGLAYENGSVRYLDSSVHSIPFDMGNFNTRPNEMKFPSAFIREHEKVLRLLVGANPKSESLYARSYFLPMVFKGLYSQMAKEDKKTFESHALYAYWKTIERMNQSFEKSPKDYLHFLNHQGLHVSEIDGDMYLHAIYGETDATIPLDQKTKAYLNSLPDKNIVFKNQHTHISLLKRNGRDSLEHLWTGYLIQNEYYKKAAYLIIFKGIRPNLAPEIMEFHMQKGLKKVILEVAQDQNNYKNRKLILASAYTIGSLLGSQKGRNELEFNPFKDELTDYSKFNKQGL